MGASVHEYRDGQWRPAVPLPFYGLFHIRCWSCGRRFWGFYSGVGTGSRLCGRYEEHYRDQHLGTGQEAHDG